MTLSEKAILSKAIRAVEQATEKLKYMEDTLEARMEKLSFSEESSHIKKANLKFEREDITNCRANIVLQLEYLRDKMRSHSGL